MLDFRQADASGTKLAGDDRAPEWMVVEGKQLVVIEQLSNLAGENPLGFHFAFYSSDNTPGSNPSPVWRGRRLEVR